MPDLSPLEARDAFSGLFRPVGDTATARLTVTPLAGLGIAGFTTRPGRMAEAAGRIAARYDGLALVPGPHAAFAGPLTVVGTGPESFLALMTDGADDFAESLAGLLGDTASVTDQTDGYATLRLSGPGAIECLNKGIAIDLHPTVFGPGAAAVTNAGHINVILWQVDETPGFQLAVFRSLAASLARFITESAAAGGIAVAG
ncbi:hypothetical protein L2U69_18415 [Zavarzinia compransoris]|uniref:sarcosine oxidase subunit gamma n=1 Tax=Zavarzinia marina TaxID=2911065 RepID=UPI001F1AE9B8|nr:hypothetical protein [Zavarzinia marina]MCF4167626.1 hypothetical protein [Zavarzinia marina]